MLKLRKKYSRTSYSQCGEDLLVQFAVNAMGMESISYLDIGTHDPVKFNNTYGLYLQGNRGVCVEPNPTLCRRICKIRPHDKCLNAGIVTATAPEQQLDFYIMKRSTLSTFSREEAEKLQSYGKKVNKILKIPVITANELLDSHCAVKPNFVSIDCEGMDESILKSFPLESHRPELFCLETISYSEDNTEEKRQGIIDYMLENNYMIYADTYINTIFIDHHKWRNRPIN